MQFPKSAITMMAAFMLLSIAQLPLSGPLSAEPDDPKLSNDRCLRCHGREGFSRDDAFGRERDLHVTAEVFTDSVHGEQDCVGCHQDITKAPHRKGIERKVGCVQCHLEEWGKVQENGSVAENGNPSTTSRAPMPPATTVTARTTSSR
jgi:hypothetical protein